MELSRQLSNVLDKFDLLFQTIWFLVATQHPYICQFRIFNAKDYSTTRMEPNNIHIMERQVDFPLSWQRLDIAVNFLA